MGENGRPGPAGPPGADGNHGAYGEEGPWGPVGEPGMPATFCPSDCGVSHILAPNYNHAPVRGGEQYEPDNGVTNNHVTPEEVEATKQSVEYKKYKFSKRM
uniref:Collagen triple helix repeat protein n=1 Tax=Panagrolaimus davidi TaxID=227884 RepID=A0A914QTC9_9BILA